MREIKFRVWFKDEKEMSKPFNIEDLHAQECYKEGDYYVLTPDNDILYGVGREIWSQYTGLKDKNGKEIYEGDIVDVPAIYDETGKIRVKVIIKWDDIFTGFAIFRDDDTDSLNKFDIERDKLEIIGNVYENSELLKGVKNK